MSDSTVYTAERSDGVRTRAGLWREHQRSPVALTSCFRGAVGTKVGLGWAQEDRGATGSSTCTQRFKKGSAGKGSRGTGVEAGTRGSGAFVRPSETEPPAATPPALAEGSMGPGLCIDTEYLGPPSGLSISHPPPTLCPCRGRRSQHPLASTHGSLHSLS